MQKVFSERRWGVSRLHRSPVKRTGWVPVTFQFLSSNELGLFHLAALLKRRGYRVRIVPAEIATRRRCQAAGWIYVKDVELNQLCLEMISLADRFRVIFDRWDLETERFCL